MYYHLLLVFTVIAQVSGSTCTIDLEAESGNSLNQTYRSEASGGLTVLLKEGEVLQNYFEIITLPSNCSVGIDNVAYSNDGISDFVQLSLNGTQLGRFRTVAQVGEGTHWNVILSTGAFGNHTQLRNGGYILALTVLEADTYGVEIDKVTLGVECTGNTGCPEVEPGLTLPWPSVSTAVHTEQSILYGFTVVLIATSIAAVIATVVCGLLSFLVGCIALRRCKPNPVNALVMNQLS